MDLLNFQNIAILAMIAPVIAFWKQIEGWIKTVFSFFIRTDTILAPSIYELVIKDIIKCSKIIRWGDRTYGNTPTYYIKPLDLSASLTIIENTSITLLYKNKIPLKISVKDGCKITYLLGTFTVRDKIGIAQAILHSDWANHEKRRSEFQIIEDSGSDESYSHADKTSEAPAPLNGSSQLTPVEDSSKALSNIFVLEEKSGIVGYKFSDIERYKQDKMLNPTYYWSEAANKLLKEVQFWKESKKWFSDRGMVHKRGSCIHGPAGTGKSKMVLEVAKKLGLTVTKLNLSNMSDNEFVRKYNNAREGIVLIEDIDVIFSGRKNMIASVKTGGSKNLISFDTLINCISGVATQGGKFTIVTTNKIDTLDVALIRAGRLDTKIYVGNIDFEGMNTLAHNILHGYPEYIEKLVCKENDSKYTAAEFEQLCIETALDIYWNKKEIK
jgi:SpoVK/Ycf46/Vps4 family AAA+-type ATPase